MIRRFLRDSVIYSLSTFISRGISFFLIPIYTRILSPADYGIIDMMSVFASIIHLTVSLEITQAVARFLPDMSSLEEKKLISSTALWFTIFTNSLFYLFAFGFSSPLSLLILGLEEGSDLFLFGSFGIICTGVSYFLSNQLRWQLQPLHNMISAW